MKIGEAHQTVWCASFLIFLVRSANKRCETCYTSTIGAGGIGAPIVVARGASVRQYIGAPMALSANRQHFPSMVSQLSFGDFFFMFGPPLLLAQGASERQYIGGL
jgi:hypothetical protein